MLREHDTVTATADLPEHGLHAGDVGAVVHIYPGKDAYEVDFFDEHGHAKGTVTLSGTLLLRLNLTLPVSHERLSRFVDTDLSGYQLDNEDMSTS